jgi:hypothetical protein
MSEILTTNNDNKVVKISNIVDAIIAMHMSF